MTSGVRSTSHVLYVSEATKQLIVLMFLFEDALVLLLFVDSRDCLKQLQPLLRDSETPRLWDSEWETGCCLMFTQQIPLITSELLNTFNNCFLFLLCFCFCSSSSVSAKTFTLINGVRLLSLSFFQLWKIGRRLDPNQRQVWCEHFFLICIRLYNRWFHFSCLFSVDHWETSWKSDLYILKLCGQTFEQMNEAWLCGYIMRVLILT